MTNADADAPRRPLTLVGYWGDSHVATGWPDVHDFVDDRWDSGERLEVGLYLTYGLVARAWMGYSRCRYGDLDLTDGIYLWPQGLAHYVIEHNVRLPDQFVQHVRRQEELADGVRVDDTWWRQYSRLPQSDNSPG